MKKLETIAIISENELSLFYFFYEFQIRRRGLGT